MGLGQLNGSLMCLNSENLSAYRKLPPMGTRCWSSPDVRLVEVPSVQPTAGHQRQCQVSGDQIEIL